MSCAPRNQLRLARIASKYFKQGSNFLWLENARFAFLEALWAKPMRLLAVLHAYLRSKSERAVTNIGKFILLLLCRPVFKAHDFCFQRLFALNDRRIRILCGRKGLLGFEDAALNIDHSAINASFGLKRLYALQQLERQLCAAKARLDFRQHNSSSPMTAATHDGKGVA